MSGIQKNIGELGKEAQIGSLAAILLPLVNYMENYD